MQFNSIHFLIFFPIVLLGFYIVPKKTRYIWLLLASYYFYMCWNALYVVLIIFSTVITYLCAIILEQLSLYDGENPRKTAKRATLAAAIIANLAVLFVFKYSNFAIDTINRISRLFNASFTIDRFDVLLPVGISFYTFQALGYLIDVYRRDVPAEHNFFKYALFVSFFPQLVAGPIERSKNLMGQLNDIDKVKFNYERTVRGFMVMMWGFFLKVVIADRAAAVVNEVFTNYYSYGGVELISGAVFFAVQIYCDFASYSTIAKGSAGILGVNLMDNFDTPYFSSSIKEFWRRWHISLSTWFRDYLYIPLGGNRRGKFRKYLNLLTVFLVSGLWHGANWTYIVWGLLHGIYQIIGEITAPFKEKTLNKLKVKTDAGSYKFIKIAITFILTDFAWIFFRSDTLGMAFDYISRIFMCFDPWALTTGFLYNIGLETQEMNILLIALIALTIVDLLKYKKNIRFENIADNQNSWARGAVIFVLIVAVVIFGSYGYSFKPQDFIYFQF